jgi:hypothetical protein
METPTPPPVTATWLETHVGMHSSRFLWFCRAIAAEASELSWCVELRTWLTDTIATGCTWTTSRSTTTSTATPAALVGYDCEEPGLWRGISPQMLNASPSLDSRLLDSVLRCASVAQH